MSRKQVQREYITSKVRQITLGIGAIHARVALFPQRDGTLEMSDQGMEAGQSGEGWVLWNARPATNTSSSRKEPASISPAALGLKFIFISVIKNHRANKSSPRWSMAVV